MRYLHLVCVIHRKPRKEGLETRSSSREAVLCYDVTEGRVTAGISFKHPHDDFRRKLGSSAALTNFLAYPFTFNLPFDNLQTNQWTEVIIDILNKYAFDIIPNLPYTKIIEENLEEGIKAGIETEIEEVLFYSRNH